jgi:hypothetical protein
MDEELFWTYIEQAKQAASEQEQLQLLEQLLRSLPPEQVKAFHYRFNTVYQRLHPSQRLRRILRSSHYTWGDDSWFYFISWIIMQGRSVYLLALQAAPELLPLVYAESEPADGSLYISPWFHPRWLPMFESCAYVALEVYEAQTGEYIGAHAYIIAEANALRRELEPPETSARPPREDAHTAIWKGNARVDEGFGQITSGHEPQTSERRPRPEPLGQPHPGWKFCPECNGTRFCPACDGQGWWDEDQRCRMCAGTGECYYCGGGGEVRESPPSDVW